MPKIKTLFDLSRLIVSNNLWKTVNNHLETSKCKICAFRYNVTNCSELQTVKAKFALPPLILNCIYESIADQIKSTALAKRTGLHHVFCWLFEHSDLAIDFRLAHNDDTLFIVKYGKYVNNLSLDPQALYREFNKLYKMIFFSVRNLQVLNLNVIFSEEMLEAIGLYCQQLKRIESFNMYNNNVTPFTYRKLLFHDYDGTPVKNKCCNTIEHFGILYSADKNKKYDCNRLAFVHSTICLLLEHFPNLKSLGSNFEYDTFLKKLDPKRIPTTSLEDINMMYMTQEMEPSLFKTFCPKIKSLTLAWNLSESFINLHKAFPNLEKLTLEEDQDCEYPGIDILTNSVWSNLTELTVNLGCADVELSEFARSFPVLKKVDLMQCDTVQWDGRTSFKFLTNATFAIYSDPNIIDWISAFSDVIEILDFYTHDDDDYFDADKCAPLLTVPLPNLCILIFNHLKYDYDFITDVIQEIPSLGRFHLGSLINTEQHKEIVEFIKDYDHDCEVHIR